MYRDQIKSNLAHKARQVPWWRTCLACKKEFKSEPSWKGQWCLDMYPRIWFTKFVCIGCASTAESACKFFGPYIPPRPKGIASPPPPCRKVPGIH